MTSPTAAATSRSETIPAVQLVVFDLGRVLIHICDHWQQAARKAGITLESDILQRFHKAADQINGPLLTSFETGQIQADTFCQQVAQLTDTDEQIIFKMLRAWLCGPCENTRQIIHSLKASGITTACLSNTNHLHWDMMHQPGEQYLDLEQLDFRFASHEVAMVKPDPKIYEHVSHQTHIKAPHILFFDDNQANCLAARKAGWQVRQITPERPSAVQIRETLKQYHLAI